MSFRVYPKYVKGNPHLRIFLPNFWMKLVKPAENQPPSQVNFITPVEMSETDAKNYLEKIYKVDVAEITSKMTMGNLRKNHKNYLVKDPDYKYVTVTLPEGQTFKFPDIFPQDKKDELDKNQKRMMEQTADLVKQRRKNWERADVPSWFGI